MNITFKPLFTVAALFAGGVLFRLNFSKEILVGKEKQPSRTTQVIFIGVLSYIVYIVAANIVVINGNGKYEVLIALTADGIAQLMFDIAAIIHLNAFISTNPKKILIWGFILPSTVYLVAVIMSSASIIVTSLRKITNLDVARRGALIFVALFRCILHALLSFLSGIKKFKGSGDKPIPTEIFYPILCSLVFLAASVINFSKFEFSEGLVALTWTLSFFSIHLLDRFIVGK